ncbi:unnamed protein product [Thlaspi arvense]|uniref:2-oxoadipate dioxygenase/decarboxylase n=2 Tax=Thlaspi arvense TaxID=13288 RepID=A0AAU9R9Q8_THLAR|nr:unnamed protein product [Thlaspi arvense]
MEYISDPSFFFKKKHSFLGNNSIRIYDIRDKKKSSKAFSYTAQGSSHMGSLDLPHASSFKGGSEIFLRNVFENILKTYLRKNPTAKTIWKLVQSVDNEKICYDHFTFRTFKVDGYGIDSLSSFFMDYGYKIGGGLDFPKKKLRVLWFSPPDVHVPNDGHGLANGPLPRLVIAELLVDELSFESQEIVRRYLIPEGGKQAVLSSTLGSLIWEKPTWTDFKQLAKTKLV